MNPTGLSQVKISDLLQVGGYPLNIPESQIQIWGENVGFKIVGIAHYPEETCDVFYVFCGISNQ